MSTKNPRINVTLDPLDAECINILSEKNKMSMSGVIKKIVEDWLEDYEDMLLAIRAERAEREWEKGGKKTISHDEFWAEALK